MKNTTVTLKKLIKKAMRYDGDVPRCATCKFMKLSRPAYLGEAYKSLKYCEIGNFNVSDFGCCMHWEGKNGATLK
jgi:hypothetical protein